MEPNDKYENYLRKYYNTKYIPEHPRYEQSQEYQLLLKKILHHRDHDKEYFNDVDKKLAKLFSTTQYNVEDWTNYGMLDRCKSYIIERKAQTPVQRRSIQQTYSIVLCISILENFYCVYKRTKDLYINIDDEVVGEIVSDVTDEFDPDELARIKIEKLLTLKNYERIKTRDLLVEYDDFRFFNLGEEFNLFNGFFRSDF